MKNGSGLTYATMISSLSMYNNNWCALFNNLVLLMLVMEIFFKNLLILFSNASEQRFLGN